MQDEVVVRRKWLSEEQFLDLLGATNLIPGPNSTEMALHIGWQRRGLLGLLVAGVAFIAPAMGITAFVAWMYVTYGAIPAVGGVLYGVKPIVLAVVFQALTGLAPKALPNLGSRVLGLACLAAMAFGAHELAVLFGAGAANVLFRDRRPVAVGLVPVAVSAGASVAKVTLPSLFWVFLKTGAVLYGSGYVLLAFLRADLVDRLGWLTEQQLLDAIAVGQVTPGPVFTTATFIGYVIAGPWGAVVATVGIFLPAFLFVAVSGPLIPRIRESKVAGAFLDGVNVASLVLMAWVTLTLARSAVVDVVTAGLLAFGAFMLLNYRVNATGLVVMGAAVGGLASIFR